MAKFETEKDVKRVVKKLLDEFGWFWWMPAANGFGKAGVSDFCALKDGVFLGIETKFGSRKPTAQQNQFLVNVEAQSGFGFVVNEKMLGDLRDWLHAFSQSVAYTSRKEVPPDEYGITLINAVAAMTRLIERP